MVRLTPLLRVVLAGLCLLTLANISSAAEMSPEKISQELGNYLEEVLPATWNSVTAFVNGTRKGSWSLDYRGGQANQKSLDSQPSDPGESSPVTVRYDLGLSRLFSQDGARLRLQGSSTLLIETSRGLNFQVEYSQTPFRPLSVKAQSSGREIGEYRLSLDSSGNVERIDFTCQMDSGRISMWNTFAGLRESPQGSAPSASRQSSAGGDQPEDKASALYRRAVVYLRNDTLDLAIETFSKAVLMDPSIVRSDGTGLSDLLQKRYQRVVSISPTNPDAYFYLGALDLFRGKGLQARQNLETAVRLDPGGSIGRQAALLLEGLPRESTPKSFSFLGTAGIGGSTPAARPAPVVEQAEPALKKDLPVGDGGLKNTGVLRFSVSGKLEGRYYARISLESLDGSFSRSVEAAEGRFRFRNIPPGVYRVYPDIGKKNKEADGTLVVSDDFTSYEAVEIEIIDTDMTDLVLGVLSD